MKVLPNFNIQYLKENSFLIPPFLGNDEHDNELYKL